MGLFLAVAAPWILPWLGGCAFQKLEKEFERAESSYVVVKGIVAEVSTPDSTLLAALYKESSEGLKLVSFRRAQAGRPFFFLNPRATYTLAVFEDVNRDFVYQEGEPAQVVDGVLLNNLSSKRQGEPDADADYVAEELQLSPDTKVGFPIDLSLASLQGAVKAAKTNFLAVVDWDDPRFARENGQRGLWEPLTFHEQTGYGLYVLEPLDPSKQPVLFVHGILDSPADLQTIASALGDEYQAVLFHYPSGFSLQYTSYILSWAIDDFLDRQGDIRLDVVAHSMGGLVARGMIGQLDDRSAAKLRSFISISTPWGGHASARAGVEWAPVVIPVWRSMVPGSKYLRSIFAKRLPENVDHHLFVTFSRARGGPSKGDDGSVTVESQLAYKAQREAHAVYGIQDSHKSVLEDPRTIGMVTTILADGSASGWAYELPTESSAP